MIPFDVDINVVDVGVAVPSEDDLKNGAPPALQVALTIGQILPFRGPDGNPVVIPFGVVRAMLDRATIDRLAEEAAKLPEPRPASNIITANNLSEVEAAAKRMQDITGA